MARAEPGRAGRVVQEDPRWTVLRHRPCLPRCTERSAGRDGAHHTRPYGAIDGGRRRGADLDSGHRRGRDRRLPRMARRRDDWPGRC
jgi:hypothetical protein